MADYFTNFSLVVPLPYEPAQEYALKLAEQASRANQGDELAADFPASLADVVEDWCFDTNAESSTEQWGLWLHSNCGGIDSVCGFIQHLLQKFDPGGFISFEWSNDCSKPRLDAYGGGAALITARRIKTMNTSAWLQKQIRLRDSKQRKEAPHG